MKVGSGQTLNAYLSFLKQYTPNKIALLPEEIHDELELHTPSELYNIGLHYLFEEKFDEALYYFENSLKTGKEISGPLVGMFYEDGIVVDKNLKKAFKIYANNMTNGINSFRCGLFLFYGCQGISQRKLDGLEMITETSQRNDLNSIHAKKFLENVDFVDLGSEENYKKKQNEKFIKSWGSFAEFMMVNNFNPSSSKDWEKSLQLILKMKNELDNEIEEEEEEDEEEIESKQDKTSDEIEIKIPIEDPEKKESIKKENSEGKKKKNKKKKSKK